MVYIEAIGTGGTGTGTDSGIDGTVRNDRIARGSLGVEGWCLGVSTDGGNWGRGGRWVVRRSKCSER